MHHNWRPAFLGTCKHRAEVGFANEVGVMYFIADTVSPAFSPTDMANPVANCPDYSRCVFLPSALTQEEDESMERT